MDRRTFIAVAAAWLGAPLVAETQQAGKTFRIGVLSELSRTAALEGYWRDAMRQRGYIEGQNTVLEFRWASEKFEILPKLAAELVQLKVDLILTDSTPPAAAAKQATATIPIITMSADPVGAGLIVSLARPGGNVTGVFVPLVELAGKRLQLMKEALPNLGSVGIVWNPLNVTAQVQWRATRAAAQVLDITAHSVEVRSQDELDVAYAAIVARRMRGLIVLQDPVTLRAAAQIADFALRNRLPASHAYRSFADAGGLMSYGVSTSGLFEACAVYADRILKGAKPADLPMEQPTKFEFVINLKTAKALGLTIPQSLLIRADQLIE